MIYKYELDPDEIKVFEKWEKEQLKKDNSNYSVNGGRFSFIFTVTGIGILVEAKDNLTEEIKLLTNIDEW